MCQICQNQEISAWFTRQLGSGGKPKKSDWTSERHHTHHNTTTVLLIITFPDGVSQGPRGWRMGGGGHKKLYEFNGSLLTVFLVDHRIALLCKYTHICCWDPVKMWLCLMKMHPQCGNINWMALCGGQKLYNRKMQPSIWGTVASWVKYGLYADHLTKSARTPAILSK